MTAKLIFSKNEVRDYKLTREVVGNYLRMIFGECEIEVTDLTEEDLKCI